MKFRSSFRRKLFDVVLDKGTTDSVLKMEDEDKSLVLCQGILSESLRLLSSSGVYLQITDEDPDLRMSLLQDLLPTGCVRNDISITHKKISEEGMWEHYMYALTKNKCMATELMFFDSWNITQGKSNGNFYMQYVLIR